VIGYRIVDSKSGGRLGFLPDVSLTPELLSLLPECDAVLFDGTFWAENEMLERGVGTLSASDMGHMPISGSGGSLKALAGLNLKHKVFFHINNTNPILLEDSPQRAAVAEAGWTVGMDGMEIII
jgi:pyrroloquinoline quinone biosynthesis protein B